MVSLVRRFQKLLIANRGEIACRIIRTARRMGLTTVVVLSEADRDAMHVDLADEAVLIGPAPAKDSYLHIEAIIDAARTTWRRGDPSGLRLSLRECRFRAGLRRSGLVFVGPSAATIRLMGSKSAAKSLMESSGVPGRAGLSRRGSESQALQSAADAVAIRSWSRHRPAAAAGACGSSASPTNSPRRLRAPSAKRVRPSATTRF
jgi:3-methylcrotonyl-CoA carboxylase alpha subunit